MVKVVALSQTLVAGAKGDELVDVGAINGILSPVLVTCSIVKVDPKTGNVLRYVSPLGQLASVTPSIAYAQ